MVQQHLDGSIGFEGQLAGEHFVKHDAQRVKVGAAINHAAFFALRLLRRKIVGRAQHHSGRGRLVAGGAIQILVGDFGDAEIQNFHHFAAISLRNQHDIIGLDVAMHDAQIVRRA